MSCDDAATAEAEPAAAAEPAAGRLRWRGALRHRSFRLFFFGQVVSLAGTWMQSIAQSWLILLLTHEPFWLGVVAAAQFTPVLVLGLFGGLLADTLPKRSTLVATQTASMLLAFILGLLTFLGVAELWHVILLATLLGLVNAIDMPSRQSFVVEMVGREDLTNAVSLNSASFNAARIAGPAVGGLVIAGWGVTVCFLLNGVSFLAVIVGLLAMREAELRSLSRTERPTSRGEVAAQLAEGIRYVRRTPVVLLGVALVGFVSTVAMNFSVVVPVLARAVLGVGAEGLGFLMAALGVGSLTSALVAATWRRPRAWIIVAGALGAGVFEIALGLVDVYAIALVAMYGLGLSVVAMAISANTSIQMAVPDRLRGRVIAVYTTVFAGSTPVGGLLSGWLGSTLGIEPTLVLGGLLALAAGLLALVWMLRGGLEGATARADEAALSPGGPRPGS